MKTPCLLKETDVRRVFITGLSGSGGSYLAEHILEEHPHIQVHGTSRWHSTTTADNLLSIRTKISVHECDLLDFGSILSVLQKVQPDIIFHFAAHANVRASFDTPNSVLTNNILSTSNLLEAIRFAKLDPVIQLCSTSEVYGQVDPKHVPIKEEAPLMPASPYAVSKVTQDLLGRVYYASYQMRVIRTRMFTYINPRRADLFASSFAKQIAWIEKDLLKELSHGNLDSVRTIIDVRDAMRAYWMAALHCQYGEAYNIGGSEVVKVGEILEKLISMSKTRINTRSDPQLFRPADVTLQIPCTDKFHAITDWKPRYSLDQSLSHLLEYWRWQADKASRRFSDHR
jgi:GDPmannose 4,6-dehydratase/GDP-4-dehydro-6-deoxy-D-mannose reductase